jgi:excisionase family DNA binding protein
MSQNAQNHWRLVYSIREAAQATGLSRATLYRLISDGRLKTVKVGARRLVPVAALTALLDAA